MWTVNAGAGNALKFKWQSESARSPQSPRSPGCRNALEDRDWPPPTLLLGCLLLTASLHPAVCEEDEYEDIDDEPEEAEGTVGEADDGDVVVLTDDNFDDKIGAHKFALVEFYAPWCGHCKNLAPHYAKAATTLKAYDSSILIAKVDATENKKVADKFGVQGYPTLKWFVDGKDSEYNGGRDEESIVRWVKKKSGPPAETVNDIDHLKKLEKKNDVFVVGYFSAFEGKDFEAFLNGARVGEDVLYTQTTSKEVATAAGITGDKTPAIVMVKNFEGYDREVVAFTETINVGNLEEFVVAEKMPLVIPFVEKNQEKIFDSGIETHVLVLHTSEALKPEADFMKMLRTVAATFKGKLMFVSVDVDDDASSTPVVNFFGADKAEAPIIFGFQMNKNKKFKYDSEANEANLKSWCTDLLAGKVEPIYKSQEPPEVDTEDNVKIVVGKTVDSVVLDPKKDVLLEVYAPWCGHCKQLEPIYKKLGKRFSSIESVVIAKMDGTENEHKEIEVQGFPSIFFFPAEEGAKSIAYEGGDRSLLSLTKFIKKHAKIPYELPIKKKDTTEEPATDKTEL